MLVQDAAVASAGVAGEQHSVCRAANAIGEITRWLGKRRSVLASNASSDYDFVAKRCMIVILIVLRRFFGSQRAA